MGRTRATRLTEIAVIAGGAGALVWATVGFPLEKIDLSMFAFFLLTISIGSRITIAVPRFKSFISASEPFIFLALLIYGGHAAVLLAAAEAFTTSVRVCSKRITVVYNTATIAISTITVVGVLKLAGLYSDVHFHGYNADREGFVTALAVIALTQFLTNTALSAIYSSLRDRSAVFETWKSKYLWSFLTYLLGAAAAGGLVQVADSIGIGVVLVAFPVCFFVFYSYKMYMQNVEISIQQAEESKRYAATLETQSARLRDSEHRFRSAFNYAPIGIGLVSPSGDWLKVNLAMTQILGYSEAEFLATDFQSITVPDDLGGTFVKINEILAGKSPNCQREQRYLHKNGRTVWTSWSVSAATDARGSRPDLIFQIQDITDRKLAEEKLQHEATHDVLTGLPNRSFFMTRLEEALAKVHTNQGHKVSILFIDLDRFKHVNDSLGHLVGDELLKGIAARLGDCMRPSDMVARLGGDEFTILVEGRFEDREVTRIAERIQQKFSQPFDLMGHEVYSTASIGILHASDQHKTPEDLMRDADTAMYQAKRAGKARHEVFDEEMHKAARETLQLETDLRRSVERDELTVVYQPIYSLETMRLEGVEALARWNHPTLGHVSPTKFIPLAEEIGLIDTLCAQILRRACRDIGALQFGRPDDEKMSMSMNLSCKQFAQSRLVHTICGILDETAFSPHLLKLEITESVFFEHADRAVAMLHKLRELGVDINIDDFGTGYSNLSYLTRLPVSTLKVDRSFVSLIDENGDKDEIVNAIVTLARNLGLRVVAEGIETEAQFNVLKRLGCESGQGYYFARPMVFAEFSEFLKGSNDKDAAIAPPVDITSIAAVQ